MLNWNWLIETTRKMQAKQSKKFPDNKQEGCFPFITHSLGWIWKTNNMSYFVVLLTMSKTSQHLVIRMLTNRMMFHVSSLYLLYSEKLTKFIIYHILQCLKPHIWNISVHVLQIESTEGASNPSFALPISILDVMNDWWLKDWTFCTVSVMKYISRTFIVTWECKQPKIKVAGDW